MTMEPTPEQFDKWVARASAHAFAIDDASPTYLVYEKLAQLAYQAGADEQLRLCVEWIRSHERLEHIAPGLSYSLAEDLESAMRPKPPSSRQRALDSLSRLTADLAYHGEDIPSTPASLPAPSNPFPTPKPMPIKNDKLDSRVQELLEKHGLREEYAYVWDDNTIQIDGNFTREFLKDLAAIL